MNVGRWVYIEIDPGLDSGCTVPPARNVKSLVPVGVGGGGLLTQQRLFFT